jgi:peptidase E
MARSYVMLIAGAGRSTSRRSVRYHRDLLQTKGMRKPRIAYVGAASGDSVAFRAMVSAMVFGVAADVYPVALTRAGTRTSAARSGLADADLIFVSGGDVERGMRAFDERDLAPYMRMLAAQGKPMEGLSAGAIMLGAHWVRFEGEDESLPEPFACLGVVPASFDTHGEEAAWDELRALASVLPAVSHERLVYGIRSHGAVVWENERLRALGEPLARFACGVPPKRLRDARPSARARP